MNARRNRNQNASRDRAANRSRPDYQTLEARQMLATFVVDSIADDASGAINGQLTLREAVIAASTNAAFGDAVAGAANGDVIRFSAALAGQTFTLTNGELDITDDLVIQGGTNAITVSGGGSSRVFDVDTSEIVRFFNFTIADGNSVQGGAISSSNSGRVIVNGMTLEDNVATGAGGGAIYNVNSDLFITNSVFRNNAANGAAGSGGAYLTVSGDSSLSGVTMQSNTANQAGGAIEIINGRMFIFNSTLGGAGVLGNVAGPVGSASPGNGGALQVTGAGGTEVYISGSSVTGNTAAREGGGLWNQAGSKIVVRANSSITANVAAGNNATNGGGGIFNNGGTVNVLSSSVSDNQATGTSGSGGGLFSTAGNIFVNLSTMAGNSANRAGGAIEVINGVTFVRDSTLGGNGMGDGNVAGPAGSAAPGNGGAVHVSGGSSTFVVEGTTVEGNTAAREGGGLWNQAGSLMIIRNGSTVTANVAQGASTGGGGIFNNGGRLVLNAVTVSGNEATGANSLGGGLLQVAGGFTLDTSSQFTGNTAVFGGGGLAATAGYLGLTGSTVTTNMTGDALNSAASVGGGLFVDGTATAVLSNVDVTSNSASTSGGGAFVGIDAYMRVEAASSFSTNQTRATISSGGGVFVDGSLRAIDSAFSSNSAGQSGGGIHISSTGGAQLTNVDVLSNNGGANGGGVFNGNGFFAEDSSISLNIVTNDGGGIFTSAGATTTLSNTSLTGNLPNQQN
jgi:hypothetical protein